MQSVGIEELHGDGILIEATASPPGMSSFPLPGAGRALRRELENADHLAVLGAMIADAPSGRVHGRNRALVRYDLAREDAARLRRALVAMGRILFAAGAAEVLTGLPRRPVVRDEAELTRAVAMAPAADLHLAGFHPTGTARLGVGWRAGAGGPGRTAAGRPRRARRGRVRPAELPGGEPAAHHHGDGAADRRGHRLSRGGLASAPVREPAAPGVRPRPRPARAGRG